MRYIVEMASGGIPSFMDISVGFQKLLGEDAQKTPTYNKVTLKLTFIFSKEGK
jgi:hypothetical protein